MKRILIILLVLAAVGAVLYFAVRPLLTPPAVTPARTAVVARQTIENTVSASGNLAPETRYDVQFGGTGRVVVVAVKEGDLVTAGQELARLDTASLALDLNDARTQLALAQLKREQLDEPPSADDLAVADANLAAAQAALQDLWRMVDPDQVEIARLGVEASKVRLWQAQLANPDPALRGYLPRYLFELGQLGTDAGDLSIAQAEANYRAARQGATRAQLDSAQAQIDQAQAQVDRLKTGPLQEDMALADAQVRSAELAVQAAQARLDKAVLPAPVDGVVAGVNVRAGDMAVPSLGALPAFIIISADRFNLSISVDEVDVAQLTVGQPVTVTLDALSELTLRGEIDRIGSVPASASATAGVVTYEVRVDLSDTDRRIRSGMTANAQIVTERRVGVLVVPNWAIRIDRDTGQAYVPVQRPTGVAEVAVILGLRNESVSEVLSGVNEGDMLVLLSDRQTLSFSEGNP